MESVPVGPRPNDTGLIDEVKDFLAGLKRELPELYPPPSNRETARLRIEERLVYWSARMGLTYGRVSIRDQRTRWGSCSSKGNLNFNWRLVFAPQSVLDYVVIHELAHLREMNHSRRFWAKVAEFSPQHREHRRWLFDNYRSLRRRREAGAEPQADA